ncbi:MAG: 30S ribosomal protein S21 [Planctomycetota bacterium]|nr:MAG: 30S ribosomal protein S21 [Planctomycetota bacterium]
MIRVQVRHNEPLEAALRRFKRQCNYAGIFRLAKKAKFYEKPSETRRRESRERARNIARQIRKANQAKFGRRKPRRITTNVKSENEAADKSVDDVKVDEVMTGVDIRSAVAQQASSTSNES